MPCSTYNAAEPIAVVGMAMRFPGDAKSSEQFWDMLSKGRSAHGKVPKDRFNADGYYHPDPARAGSVRTVLQLVRRRGISDMRCRSISRVVIFLAKILRNSTLPFSP